MLKNHRRDKMEKTEIETYEKIIDEAYDDEEYYTVDFRTADAKLPDKTLRFKVTTNGIEIDASEDNWEKVNNWDYHVKYFWMALLSWEI